MSDDLSISKTMGKMRSNAMEKLQEFRQNLQQRPHHQPTVGHGSLADRLANYSSYSVDTSCARPTNQ